MSSAATIDVASFFLAIARTNDQTRRDAGRYVYSLRVAALIWPLDSGQYGLDARFQGHSGFERMEIHEALLKEASVRYSLVQELGDGWTLRFGPLSAAEVSRAFTAFVR